MIADAKQFAAQQPRLHKRRRILHPMLRALGYLTFKVEATGLERIPDTGAAILMINHINLIDPVVFTGIVPNRYVISMAKVEVLDSWFLRSLLRLWGNFVVRRGEVDRRALYGAIELLKQGEVIVIAVEGTRNPDGLTSPKAGIPYIAHKTNALVIPMTIGGVAGWGKRLLTLRQGYARVNVGKPFRFRVPDGQRLDKATRDTMLREAMYQLALAIPDDYAHLRGDYHDVLSATTETLVFREPVSKSNSTLA